MSAATILVVEDNPITRKMLRLALESEGYRVVDAGQRDEALRAAASLRPDLVLVDYVLPDADGLELLAEMRQCLEAPELAALLVTGMVSRLDDLRARAGAFTHVLPKPVEPRQLAEFVRAHLATRPTRTLGASLLVLDDDALNLKLTALRLAHAGYEVRTAGSGAEGLESARARAPDAVLTDVLMPGMDGFAFCLELRRDPRLARVPVVLVSSAYVEDADQELARRVGANRLVLRTPDMGEALAALERCLGEAGAQAPEPGPDPIDKLHRERVQVQLERQTARNEVLLRQATVQATALSVIRGLSEALAQPRDAPRIIGDVLVHCLDATGLSTGLLYVADPDGRYRLEAQFGLTADRRAQAAECFGQAHVLRRIAEAGEPCALSPGPSEADADVRGLAARLGQTSVLVVPFTVLARSFGVLVLASDTHELADEAWIAFARGLGTQFGQTVALGQSLARLAASEGRLRAIMEQANDAILISDLERRVLEVNREAERLLGRPREAILGRLSDEFVVAEQRQESARGYDQLRADGTLRVEGRLVLRGDGSATPVDLSASVVRVGTQPGEAVLLAILRDVSERRRADVALRETQRRLHHMVSSSPSVLYSLRPEGRGFAATWFSENVERLLGYTADEALQPRWWRAHVHPDDRARVQAEMDTLLGAGHLAHEYRFQLKAGGYRWLHAELRLVRGARGEPLEAIGSWSDVTERKQAELQLRESEEQYRLLFDSNPHPMWVAADVTREFLAVNDAALRQYGWSREEFLGLTTDALEAPAPAAGRASAAGGAAQAWRHRRKDGTPIDVDGWLNPILFQGRAARLTLAIDVSERETLAAQLQISQRMESVGLLAGGVAHDFNNLLGVILGYGEIVRKRLGADSHLAKYVDDILKAAERAAGLTRQLLAFSRRQVLQPRVLDLNEVVGEMERMLRRLIGEDVRLVAALAEGLPPIRADPGQLEQVLMNLVVNARDAMPQGGRLVIETDSARLDDRYAAGRPDVEPGHYAVLAVSDTGVGMSSEVRAHIFDPFFTTKAPGKGTGLGLATVHGIVRQSGGHIVVESEPGHGSTFRIYLPAVEAAPRPDRGGVEEPPPRGTETVLVVEDEAALRELILDCLEASGYRVLHAPDGPRALELSARHAGTIDLLLTDVVMPGLGGTELAARLTRQRPGMKVLFMSGYTGDAVLAHGVLTRDMPFLEKPFTVDRLARKVREALDRA